MKKMFVHIDRNKGVIQADLHGQFIELLGSCIYDGIWVGEDRLDEGFLQGNGKV